MSEILGVNTREVFDYMLSTVTPTTYNRGLKGKSWVIELNCQATGELKESHDTGIPCEKGDSNDLEKRKKCFEWLKSVRDKYARPDIEELKPEVAVIRHINDDLCEKARDIPTQAEYNVMAAQYKTDLESLAQASKGEG